MSNNVAILKATELPNPADLTISFCGLSEEPLCDPYTFILTENQKEFVQTRELDKRVVDLVNPGEGEISLCSARKINPSVRVDELVRVSQFSSGIEYEKKENGNFYSSFAVSQHIAQQMIARMNEEDVVGACKIEDFIRRPILGITHSNNLGWYFLEPCEESRSADDDNVTYTDKDRDTSNLTNMINHELKEKTFLTLDRLNEIGKQFKIIKEGEGKREQEANRQTTGTEYSQTSGLIPNSFQDLVAPISIFVAAFLSFTRLTEVFSRTFTSTTSFRTQSSPGRRNEDEVRGARGNFSRGFTPPNIHPYY